MEDEHLNDCVLIIDSIMDRLFCDSNLAMDDRLVKIKENIDNIKSEG